jgi:hypothetical protein
MKGKYLPLISAVLLIVGVVACDFPAPGTPPATEVGPAVETEGPVETPPEVEVSTATPEPSPDPLVVTYQGGTFNIYMLDGTIVETRLATGMADWSHPNSYQVVGDVIYYVDSGGDGMGGNVKRATVAGIESLPFTAVPDLSILKFAISGDGSTIAWAAGEWGNSNLWVSDINGGGAHLVIQSDPSLGLEDYYVLETYRWTADGHLLFAWQISGIGNILYFGYSSMYRYTLISGEITALYEVPTGGGGPCWHTVSEDGLYLVGTCMEAPAIPGLREREIATGIETVLPLLPNQDQTGSAVYSPSGIKLAYAYARGGIDDVDGYIAVRLNPGDSPITITSIINGYFQKILWVDEDRLVVQGTEADVLKTYLLTLDGVLTPIADGELIGLMQP